MSSEPSEKRSKVPMKLGYWKIRGVSNKCLGELIFSRYVDLIVLLFPQLAQAIRLLLKYTETEFEDVLYEQGEGMHTFSC